MFNIDEFDPKRIIEIIESVDETLQYSSIDLFKRAMVSIGFVVRLLKKYPIYGNLYSCKGQIEDKIVHLDIYQKNNNDMVCVSQKFYYREILVGKRVKRLAHRDNDLPAVIYYDEFHGKVTELRYFMNNSDFREIGKPILIKYKYDRSNEISLTSYRFCCQKYLNYFVNFSLYEVTYRNNLIVDGAVCYNNELLSLKELLAIIQDINVKNLDDLLNLKNMITKDHVKLIDMIII